MRSAAFVTLGCKVNQYETQVMREALKRRGFRIVAPDDAADVYVINTCTVTGISDRKSRQMIRRAVALNPDAIVVVTGCYAERSPDEIRNMPGVDLVLSNREKFLIGEYLGGFDGKIPLNPPLRKGEAGSPLSQRGDSVSSPLKRGVRGDLNGSSESIIRPILVDSDTTPSDTPIPAFPHRGGRDLPVDGEVPLDPPLQKGEASSPLKRGVRGDLNGGSESIIRPILVDNDTTPLDTPVPVFSRRGGRSVPVDGEIPPDPPLRKGRIVPPFVKEGLGGISQGISRSPGHSPEAHLKGRSNASSLRSPRLCREGLDHAGEIEKKTGPDSFSYPPITSFDGQTRALVKIEDGCDSFCIYCIVPHVRGGTIRSRPIDSIVREVRALAGNGHREVVLTGVHLGAYGRDLADGTNLAHVLRAIHDVDGIQRIRLSSIEPMDISDDLIGEMARLPKCAHHFHVSLQSGSDKILKLMRRGYTSAEFEDVVNRIRRVISDVGISTDVMVGFPGETERDFRDTCDLIARVKFSRLHVFRYSPREGTPAAEFPDRVQEAVASRRSRDVRALGDSLAREFRSRMLGQEAQVLVEDTREGKDKLLAGFTGNYVRVLVADAPDELAGRMVRVKLMNMENEHLVGLMGSGL